MIRSYQDSDLPMRPARPLLAGNGQAAIDVLNLLLQSWDPPEVLVVAPAQGPKHSWQSSLANNAEKRGVRVLTPEGVNDPKVIRTVREHGTDLLLSVYYTQIFNSSLLSAVDGRAFNFHPSLLPLHRGTAPLIWAIAEGDSTTGVSVHKITAGVDAGPLLWKRSLPIHPQDTGFVLHQKAAALVRSMAAELIRRLLSGKPLPDQVEQSGESSIHTSTDRRLNSIDWSDAAERVRNIVRALASPLPGAYTTWQQIKVGLEEVQTATAPGRPRPPGEVQLDQGQLLVWTGSQPVHLVRVRLDDEILCAEALLDQGIRDGDTFG